MSSPARIGFLTSCGIVVANIIGTGVFTSLGFQVAEIHSGFVLLSLWVIGGIVALCGALCYGELSAALPRSGGEYHFLSAIYHPALGFMAGFVSATVGFAAPIALAAMAFGKYADGVLHWGSPVALSFVLVWINALVHLRGTKTGSVFQDSFTLLKIILIAVLIIAGFLSKPWQPVSFQPAAEDSGALLQPGLRRRAGFRDVRLLRAGTPLPISPAKLLIRKKMFPARSFAERLSSSSSMPRSTPPFSSPLR